MTASTVSYGHGVVRATMASGPMILVPGLAVNAAQAELSTTLNMLPAIFFALFASIILGVLVSFGPNIAGATALALLGRTERWARHPLFWIMAGAAFGGMIGIFLFGANEPWDGAGLFAMDGAACASICRWGTRWYD